MTGGAGLVHNGYTTDSSSSCSSMPCGATSILDHLGQLLLGTEPAHSIRSAARFPEPLRSVGILHPVRSAVDVASTTGQRDLIRTRLSMVTCPEEPTRRRQKSIAKTLTSATSEEELDQTIAMMKHTDDLEREISVGTSYLDCFRGADLRRTEITCLSWACQPLCGASLVGFPV